ncbi:AfsR/SARP family transcriptional regulator [Actinoplanes sp. N902-109]|uniref:AfsR/SARP family transcriptional regulator n=1 Tax=Actinoplanes sp. (strain N902-109) TaxID=649831 RepID=UPI001E4507E1|nr:AfsR/SARP family transcriptional regulator [Actinoplanes sp. N902-109]
MQTVLLAALLAAEGQIVSVGALAEDLWGGDQPESAENALQAHASRLRRKLQMLEPGRKQTRLVSQTGGYRLDLTGARVDAMAFYDEISAVRADPDMAPTEVIRRLRGALALWRGPVFGGVTVGVAAQAAAARLSATRISVLELLFDTELKLGQHSTIIPELTELVRGETLNERLCELLMVALYRSGRQTDALNAYQRMRHRMAEELGVDPSPMLRNHERAILAHDRCLLLREDHRRLRATA